MYSAAVYTARENTRNVTGFWMLNSTLSSVQLHLKPCTKRQNWTEPNWTASCEFTHSATEKIGFWTSWPSWTECMSSCYRTHISPSIENAILRFKQENFVNSLQLKSWLVVRSHWLANCQPSSSDGQITIQIS